MEATTITPTETQEPGILNTFQQEALKQAITDYNNLAKENDEKKYLVDLKKEDIELMYRFISEEANWKFTESIGIVECEKDLQKAKKAGKIFVHAYAIEAMHYYLSKVEGSGKTINSKVFTIEDYIRAVKAIDSKISSIKEDRAKLKKLEMVVSARQQGLDLA